VADAAARGGGGVGWEFFRLSAVPVVADVGCLDAVQLRSTALVR
jgi:hypothetical protein